MMNSLLPRLNETAALTSAALEKYLARYRDADYMPLYESMLYSVMSGGKRIRPFLTLEFSRICGGSDEIALPFACAIEAVHNYSLIHDDMPCMDNDLLRRGKPTTHAKFGEATALLAGDALLTAAFEMITDSGADYKAKLRAVSLLASGAGASGMIAGQQLDMRGEREKLGLDTLKKMNLLKTGRLIKTACLLGCTAAGAEPDSPLYRAADEYSEHIGLSFQLTDDLLDYGTEDDKTTYMTYLTPESARKYACELTEDAIAAIKAYDPDGTLRAFAEYIRDRKK